MRQHLSALLLFTLLTIVVAFPVIAIMARGGVPGWEGDNVYYVHSMWWWKHALIDLQISPFVDPESFYPVGRDNGRSELTVTNTIPAIPVTWLFSPATGYNVMVLLSFVTTGFFTYLWMHRLCGRRDAAILAGTIAAFMPLRFAHLAGHLPQLTTQWLPLTLFACERLVERRTIERGLFVGIGVALTALGCWYYGYALAIVLPVYVILRTWRSPVWRERRWWTGILAATAIAGVLITPFVYKMLQLRGEGHLARTLGEMDSWSLNPYDLFLPNLLHPLWGDAASRWLPHQRALWVEKGVTLGYVAVGLAIAGWLSFRRRERRIIGGLFGTWLVSYSIALGPTLQWGNEQVRVPVPLDVARLASRHLAGTVGENDTRATRESFANVGVPVPLPAFFMFTYVPMTSSMRVMARFAVWTAFMTAALAGFGLIALIRWTAPRGGRLTAAIAPAAVFLVILESVAVVPTMPLIPRAVDTWLAGQPSDVVIVELPVEQAQRSLQNYWMTVNQRKNLFGWVGDSFPPPIEVERAAALQNFPAAATLAYLQRSSATHLLVTPAHVPDWATVAPILRASPALADERIIGDVHVYRVVR